MARRQRNDAPQASFVAGVKAWMELGYCVRKGELAIWIFAPMSIRARADAESDDDDQTGRAGCGGFVARLGMASMSRRPLPGRLSRIEFDGELPRRGDVGLVFDELDYQLACQAYLWASPLVSYAQWQNQHYVVFGATNSDIVHYVSYRDRLGLITANATTPYILNFFDLNETGPLVVELPPGPTAGGVSDFWQREIGVMGEMGPDKGRGGKHVIVSPGQAAPDVDGFFTLQSTGMNVMFGFRDRARQLRPARRVLRRAA